MQTLKAISKAILQLLIVFTGFMAGFVACALIFKIGMRIISLI